jgi:hypothetical protein
MRFLLGVHFEVKCGRILRKVNRVGLGWVLGVIKKGFLNK